MDLSQETKIIPIALLERPLYINDNGVVSCQCGFTFEHIGRRTNVSELLVEINRHMKEECLQPPKGKSQYEIDCEREGLPLIPLPIINDYPADIDDAKEMKL